MSEEDTVVRYEVAAVTGAGRLKHPVGCHSGLGERPSPTYLARRLLRLATRVRFFL